MANPFETWSLDREIVLVKLLNHPRDKVFAAWMDPKALTEWYGPAGLAIETHEDPSERSFGAIHDPASAPMASPTRESACATSPRYAPWSAKSATQSTTRTSTSNTSSPEARS